MEGKKETTQAPANLDEQYKANKAKLAKILEAQSPQETELEPLDENLQLSDRLDAVLKLRYNDLTRIMALEAARELHEAQIAELSVVIAQHAARFAALEAIVEPLLDAPQERSTKPPKSEGVTLRGDVFTVKNKKYRLRLAQFSHYGRTVTEDDLLADVALQKELVEEGLGVIEAV